MTVADEAVSAEMVRAADSFADHCTRALGVLFAVNEVLDASEVERLRQTRAHLLRAVAALDEMCTRQAAPPEVLQ